MEKGFKMKLRIKKGQPLFFTSDEHFCHKNVIEYCSRPFQDVREMDEQLIKNFNEKVPKDGFTVHGGDFFLGRDKKGVRKNYVSRLNGEHFFLMGSHDSWLPNGTSHEMVELCVDKQNIVVCHYAMRVWPKSHYNSWLLYGHSHGGLPSEGKSYDIGVDNNWYYPVSYEEIRDIMSKLPDNFNLVRDRSY